MRLARAAAGLGGIVGAGSAQNNGCALKRRYSRTSGLSRYEKGVTGLIKHHKVAAASSQPRRGRPDQAINGLGLQSRRLELAPGLC
jgi:hypothetical protein